MKSFLTLVVIAICSQRLTVAQPDIIIKEQNALVSSAAFNETVLNDFSYLIFSELSPEQGLSTTVKENGTQILINGTLFSNSFGTLALSADLSATDGIYFVDEGGGSKAGISLNYFKNIASNYSYESETINLLEIRLNTYDLLVKAQQKLDSIFYNLANTIDLNSLGTDTSSDSQNTLLKELKSYNLNDSLLKDFKEFGLYKKLSADIKDLSEKYLNSQNDEAYDNFPKWSTPAKNTKVRDSSFVLEVNLQIEGEIQTIKLKSTKKLKLAKLIEDFVITKNYINNRLEKEIIANQIKIAKSLWTIKRTWFMSAHPFYSRESLTLFNENIGLFKEAEGDLYGIRFNFLNYSYQSLKGKMPLQFLGRLGVSASRISNRPNSSPTEITTTINSGFDVDGNPLTRSISKNAFSTIDRYEYGNSLGLAAEIYIYPSSLPIGFFSTISANYRNFAKGTGIENTQAIPFNAGLLFNFKSKDKNKDSVVFQLFAARQDLYTSPKNDNEWRIGFGVGVPLSF